MKTLCGSLLRVSRFGLFFVVLLACTAASSDSEIISAEADDRLVSRCDSVWNLGESLLGCRRCRQPRIVTPCAFQNVSVHKFIRQYASSPPPLPPTQHLRPTSITKTHTTGGTGVIRGVCNFRVWSYGQRLLQAEDFGPDARTPFRWTTQTIIGALAASFVRSPSRSPTPTGTGHCLGGDAEAAPVPPCSTMLLANHACSGGVPIGSCCNVI